MANGFQGLDGQQQPVMPDEFVWEVSNRYIELYEKVTGKAFEKANTDDILNRIEKNIITALS
jgi:phosphoribosylaminoimidazole-succinocarboxamide synthase